MDGIAVTGASGFIGANIVLHLAAHGRRVVACDRETPPAPLLEAVHRLPGSVRWLVLDVTRNDTWAALDAEPVTVLIHAAAVTPGGFDAAPGQTIRVNLGGTIEALEYARRRGLRRMVFTSSSGVYGALRSTQPLPESHPVSPDTAYSLAKLTAEHFVSLYRKVYGIDACSVRLAAPYGPWERPTSVRTRMSTIFQLATSAVRGEPLRVAGTHISRDWTYVGDVAAGVVHLAAAPMLPYDLFNLSAAVAVTLADVVDTLRQVAPEARIDIVPQARADLALADADHRAPLDVTRLRSAGFEATTKLDEGLRRYVDWLRGPGAFVVARG